MLKNDQKGSGLFTIFLIIVLIGAITGAGWYVLTKNRDKSSQKQAISSFDECVAAGNPVQEAYPQECSANGQTYKKTVADVFSIDTAKLPSGWQVNRDDSEHVILDNSAIDINQAQGCYVSADRFAHSDAKKDNAAPFAEKMQAEAINTAENEKGYTLNRLADSTITIQLTEGAKNVSAFYGELTAPDKSFKTYQKTAYLVEDGYYTDVTESCGSTNFTDADKALSAITVKE